MGTALAVIDMQNWMFRSPRDAERLPALVRKVNVAADLFRSLGHPIFDIRTIWTADPATWTLRCRDRNEPKLLAGSADAAPVPGLRLPPEALSVVKTRNSAFVMTDFHALLTTACIDRLFLTGCFDEACIGFTAIDAYERNIQPVVVEDAVACSDEDLARGMRRLMEMVGDIPRVSFEQAQDMAARSGR